MALMDLTVLEMLQGSLSLLNVLIITVIGLKISSKYSEYKRKELLTVGISLIFTGGMYWPSSVSFVTYVLFEYTLEFFLYSLLSFLFQVISHYKLA